MKWERALRLQYGDMVTVKRTGEVLEIIDIEKVPKEFTSDNINSCSIMLSDGNWYGYKEIK